MIEMNHALIKFQENTIVDRLEIPVEPFKGKLFPVMGKLGTCRGHPIAPGFDAKHSSTRGRAAQLNGDILDGNRDCFIFVAKSGLTQLTVTSMEDRVDMQSDVNARILFSIEVQAALELFADIFKDDEKVSKAFRSSGKVCRFFRLYYEILTNTSITPEIRLSCTGFLLVSISRLYNIFKLPTSIKDISGIPNKTFQGIAVNLWSSFMINQIVAKPVYPRSIVSSQPCEHVFSTVQKLSPSPTGSILATMTHEIMSRAIYINQRKMSIEKKFSYLPSKAPIYHEELIDETEETHEEIVIKSVLTTIAIPKPHKTTKLPFKSQFNFPLRHSDTAGYKITNVATVRSQHRFKPQSQYAAIAERHRVESQQVIDLQPSLEENGGSQVLNCGRGCGRGRGGGRGRDGVHGHSQQVIDLQPSHEENGSSQVLNCGRGTIHRQGDRGRGGDVNSMLYSSGLLKRKSPSTSANSDAKRQRTCGLCRQPGHTRLKLTYYQIIQIY